VANLTQTSPPGGKPPSVTGGFPKEFNRNIVAEWDRRFLLLLLISFVVLVSFVSYQAGQWREQKLVDWAAQKVPETGAVELKLEEYLPRPLAGNIPSRIAPGGGGGEEAGEAGAGEGGPKRVNRSRIGGGGTYAGHQVAFMAPSGGESEAGRARKEFAPMIGSSKGYDFRPGQLAVHTEAGALPALASVRKGSAEVYEAGGLKTISGKYTFSGEEGAVGLSGSMEIGVTAKMAEEKGGGGGTRSYQSIYDIVSANRSEIFYCLQSERKRDITLKGNIEMEVTLNQAGRVTNVQFSGQTWWSNPTSGKRVESCIRHIVEGWDFGMGAGDAKSKTTFNLSFLWT
jgi:hypothetical protein